MPSQTLIEQLAGQVNHGDHLCVICEDPRERLEAAAQYISDGLRQNEFVMYAADADTTHALRGMLVERGIDVDAQTKRGALNFPTAYDAYLRDGDFNPDLMYETFDTAISQALAAGYSGCRFAGEPVWAIEKESLRPGLIEFEARLNGLFRQRKAAGLCVYDKKAWPAEVVRDVIRTHPIAVVGDLVCKRNPFYERPELREHDGSTEAQISWMLTQLRELCTQEARLQLALEAGRLGNWELNLADDTSVRSLRHDQIFGYDRLLPRWGYEIFIQHVLPEDRERVTAAFRNALANGTTWHFECRIRRNNDGAVRCIEAHGRPDPEGARGDRIQRLLGIVADITERKELEQALRDADRRKDEFLATLAHELRNPLAPILNSLQLIRIKGAADPQLMRAEEVIERQVRHLVRLVDDLLEVSRITTGRITLQRERVELGAVLANAIEASQPLIDAARHQFSVNVPSTPIYVEADATRLAQVFLNVLNNAAKYTPPGGRIELTATHADDVATVRIRDNGVGFTREMIPEIFKMFVQGHRTGERAQSGLGIGLPLARQLLELHGGSIEAHSDGPGRGAEFTVRLPALAREPVNTVVPSAVAPRAPGSKRILVVDDNVDAADTLAMSLELLGQEVTTRYDGRSALDATAALNPDVVILDIGLPDFDGYQVARQIRASQSNVMLIALTGWGQEKDRVRAREAGFDQHRTKPVDANELLELITSARPRV